MGGGTLAVTDFYILKDGKPVKVKDITEWAAKFELSERHIAVSESGGVRVSTVFLGVDLNYSGKGPPMLFETMVFGRGGERRRYATLEEARLGHERMVAAWLP